MKKILRIAFLAFAFTTATIFMSCSDTIPEASNGDLSEEQLLEESDSDDSRYCFSGSGRDRIGHDCGNRRNNHSNSKYR